MYNVNSFGVFKTKGNQVLLFLAKNKQMKNIEQYNKNQFFHLPLALAFIKN